MAISAIIPVKTFSNAKSRLDVPSETKGKLCRLMFEEVLRTISVSNAIDSIIVVSKDQDVFDVAKKFRVTEVEDGAESGVNNAVSLADDHLGHESFDASIVFPQDIPFMKTQDIDFLLQFQKVPSCALVVPSRKFDGTNALLRMPTNLMGTHYDEDSYKIHLAVGKQSAQSTSLVFVKRIMMDIDDNADLSYCLKQNEKPDLCNKIEKLLE